MTWDCMTGVGQNVSFCVVWVRSVALRWSQPVLTMCENIIIINPVGEKNSCGWELEDGMRPGASFLGTRTAEWVYTAAANRMS